MMPPGPSASTMILDATIWEIRCLEDGSSACASSLWGHWRLAGAGALWINCTDTPGCDLGTDQYCRRVGKARIARAQTLSWYQPWLSIWGLLSTQVRPRSWSAFVMWLQGSRWLERWSRKAYLAVVCGCEVIPALPPYRLTALPPYRLTALPP